MLAGLGAAMLVLLAPAAAVAQQVEPYGGGRSVVERSNILV